MDEELDRMIAEGSPVPPEPEEDIQPPKPYDWEAEGQFGPIEVRYAE